jgi:5-methylcytosine-specific restriction protein A
VPEWIGKSSNEAIPARVKLRIFDAAKGCCESCGVKIRGGTKAEFDHTIALINGGINRELNLSLLCVPCHKVKTGADVAEKKDIARKRKKHLGIVTPRKKIQSRGFAKSEPQRTASRPLRRFINDNAEG